MSKRIDITGQIFGNILVLEFDKNANTHALYKCLCMCCNTVLRVTYSNLTNKNTRNCRSCANKRTTYHEEWDILEKYRSCENIAETARQFSVDRTVVRRILKEHTNKEDKSCKSTK